MMYRYKAIRVSPIRVIDEHRIVMSQQLGRPLTSSEIVHHANNKGKDNAPANLELTTRSGHAKYHMMMGDLHNIQNDKEAMKRGRNTVAERYGKRIVITDITGTELLTVRSIKMAAKVCKCSHWEVMLILRGIRNAVRKTFKFKLA